MSDAPSRTLTSVDAHWYGLMARALCHRLELSDEATEEAVAWTVKYFTPADYTARVEDILVVVYLASIYMDDRRSQKKIAQAAQVKSCSCFKRYPMVAAKLGVEFMCE